MSILLNAIDVSSYQPADLTSLIQELKPDHVVVRLYLPIERIPRSHSLAQIASAKANGCSVGGYVWGYLSYDPALTAQDAVSLALQGDMRLTVLWLDVEEYEGQPGPDAAWIRAFGEACERLGVVPGIYSAAWYWRQHMRGVRDFETWPWWVAEYSGVGDFQVDHFEGMGRLVGHQYTDKPVDRSVFTDEVVASIPNIDPAVRQQVIDSFNGWARLWSERPLTDAEIARMLAEVADIPRMVR